MQWRVMGSVGRFGIASGLLACIAVWMVPSADTEDSAGYRFHLRARQVSETPGAVAPADADDDEREKTNDGAG
jgi:hypothetical protein